MLLVPALLLGATHGIDNGVGLTPPMGWRHWKAFAAHISQDIMESMMDEMVKQYVHRTLPNPRPSSAPLCGKEHKRCAN